MLLLSLLLSFFYNFIWLIIPLIVFERSTVDKGVERIIDFCEYVAIAIILAVKNINPICSQIKTFIMNKKADFKEKIQ